MTTTLQSHKAPIAAPPPSMPETPNTPTTAPPVQLDAFDAYLDLGRRLFEAGDFSGAQAAARLALEREPNRFEPWSLFACSAASRRHYVAAAGAFLEALKRKPDDVGCWTNLGEVYLALMQIEEASALRQAMELDPQALHPAGKRARAIVAKTIARTKK
jgi:Flp pilus assembly protein TadD